MAEASFLVVRLGSLGDIVHTFPAVAALRETFPGANITWCTHPRWVELVASAGLASEILAVDSRNMDQVRAARQKIRAAKWDAAIDYQGLWKSAVLGFLGRVARRIGFSSAAIREFGVPILYTERVTPKSAHVAEQNGELSLRAGAKKAVGNFGLRLDDAASRALKSELARQGIADRYVVLSPGGGWRSKCWPAERFGDLCGRIEAKLGLRCVVNFGPGERPLFEAVAAASGNARPLAYEGELAGLMALLRGAVCVVGGDTGPLHLGVALGAKPVAIFGPTDPARNGPYPAQPVVLRSSSAVTTYKRGVDTDPSLLKISVDEVFAAVVGFAGAAQ
jgi:heptosyltransferase I